MVELNVRLSSGWRIGLLIISGYYSHSYGLVFDQSQSSGDSSSASTAPAHVGLPAPAVMKVSLVGTSELSVSESSAKPAVRVSPIVLYRTLSSGKLGGDGDAGIVRVSSSKNVSLATATIMRLGGLSPRAAGQYRSRSSQSLAGLADAELMSTPIEPLALSIGQLARPRTLSALEDEPGQPNGSALGRFSPLMVLIEAPDISPAT